MEHRVYQTNRISFFEYEFFSEGPKGNIRKRIKFSKSLRHDDMVELSLLDVDIYGNFSDTNISNNNDHDIIFNTVAITVLNFSKDIPGKHIFFVGSTPGRNRLYRMTLSKKMKELENDFEFFGLLDGA